MSDYSRQLSGKSILVTGGNGYIGSHTVIALVEAGASVTIVDSLVNSQLQCYSRILELVGAEGASKVSFHQIDLRDYDAFESQVFAHRAQPYDAVIHFAGLKAVGESVAAPLKYYEYNLGSTVNLVKCMDKHGCRNLVFSSSATVYGLVNKNPITESFPLSTTNPYGSTKLVIENLLREVAAAPLKQGDQPWCIAILRYFNPIGAHPSGRIGEDPSGIPNNLLPFVLQVAVGRRKEVTVFGSDWPTRDGTGVRDFIHVTDLALGHLASLAHAIFAPQSMSTNCEAYNLGTGRGNSVMEIIQTTENVSGKQIPYVVGPRRSGDIAECYSDPTKAERELQWRATRTLEQAIADSWKWQQLNPNGFAGPQQ